MTQNCYDLSSCFYRLLPLFLVRINLGDTKNRASTCRDYIYYTYCSIIHFYIRSGWHIRIFISIG